MARVPPMSVPSKQSLEYLGVLRFQAVSELVDVKRVRLDASRTHSNREIGSHWIQVEQDQTYTEERAQRFQAVLVFLCHGVGIAMYVLVENSL
jgi:hypothetical protein